VESIAYMLQRNPSMVLVLLVGLPALTWAGAYARRPSRTRRILAAGALMVTIAIAVVAAIEAHRDEAPWFPPLVLAALIAVAWTLLYVWRPKYR
jgi:UDP-N-acetylmuramyl pentapeptide phosphotransferase/UDP-N-acetylglucosamine-1-phosphate transferase